jgi:hypothetical protein
MCYGYFASAIPLPWVTLSSSLPHKYNNCSIVVTVIQPTLKALFFINMSMQKKIQNSSGKI